MTRCPHRIKCLRLRTYRTSCINATDSICRRARMESQRVGRGRRPRRPATAIKRKSRCGAVAGGRGCPPLPGEGIEGLWGKDIGSFIRKSSDALLLRCSDAEVGQDRASGVDLLTEYEPFPFAVYKIAEVCYNFGIFVNNENAKSHSGCSR